MVSAAVELIFFLVASIVLCFGFRMEMLITQGCFICCRAVLMSVGLESFPPHQGAGWGAQEAERGHSRTADQNWPNSYPISLSIHNLGESRQWQLLGNWLCIGQQVVSSLHRNSSDNALALYIIYFAVLMLVFTLLSLTFLSYVSVW